MQKTDIQGLEKDESTGAVLSTDDDALAVYKAKKRQIKKMEHLEKRMHYLEEQLKAMQGKLDMLCYNNDELNQLNS